MVSFSCRVVLLTTVTVKSMAGMELIATMSPFSRPCADAHTAVYGFEPEIDVMLTLGWMVFVFADAS